MARSIREKEVSKEMTFGKADEAGDSGPDQIESVDTVVESPSRAIEKEMIEGDTTLETRTNLEGDLIFENDSAGGSMRPAIDDLDADSGGSSLFDDVGGSIDPLGAFDDLDTGGGPGDFADPSSWAMDGSTDETEGPPSLISDGTGGHPGGYSQWGEHDYSSGTDPDGGAWSIDAYGEPHYPDEGEAVQTSHGDGQPTGEDGPDGPGAGEWGNILEREEHDQGGGPTPEERNSPPRQEEMGGQGDEEDDDKEDQYAQEEQDDETQGHSPQQSTGGNQTPVPEEADTDFGHGGLDGSVGGDVDPDPDLAAAGDAGGLKTGTGDIDYDPDLADVGEVGALEHQLVGSVDPIGAAAAGPPTVVVGATADHFTADSFSEEADISAAFSLDGDGSDIEIDDSSFDFEVEAGDALG